MSLLPRPRHATLPKRDDRRPGAINARVGVNISGRAVGPIVHGRAVATNRLRQDLVEDLGSPWARVKVVPDHLVHGLHLIASSPQRQTRMISETAGLIVSLGTDLGHELFIVAGIVNAGEHKVVPHEDAVFVTGSHEGVGSIDTAAPDAHHRHIGIAAGSVSYTHLRAHETSLHLVCRLLLEKKK